MDPTNWFESGFAAYAAYWFGFAVRYLLIAGGVFYVLQIWGRRRFQPYRIQKELPSHREIGGEILWSLSTPLCTGLSLFVLYSILEQSQTRMYFAIAERGWVYFGASVALGIVGYDAWFYWHHRLLHTPWLFRNVHAIHHRSTNPTAFAAFSHHPIETFGGNIYFLVFPLVVPIHPLAYGLVGLYFFAYGIAAHGGYELMPSGFTRHPLFKWYNTATHHNLHHSDEGCNYGLCFNYWDRFMNTNHPQYDQIFESIAAQHPGAAAWKGPDRADAEIPLAALRRDG